MKQIFTNAAKVFCGMMMLCTPNIPAKADVVISKVFYAGTTQKGNTKNYSGGEEYIELYNNDSKEYDIAGMCIGLIESEATTGAYLASDRTDNEVKLKQVFQIPDDGARMLPPYTSVIIAACAKDHSADAENGPDLSKADYSFGNMAGDAENVTKLNLLFSFNANTKVVNLTNGGDAGIILIAKKNVSKLAYNDESKFVFANGKTSGSKYLPFNAYYAMDAVEILKTKDTNGVYAPDLTRKRLKPSFDNSCVMADQKMLRDGYIAYRKTALNNDGQKYLYDTNDSSVDFQISKNTAPGSYDDNEIFDSHETITIPESGYLPFNSDKYFFTDKGVHVAYVNITSGVIKFIDSNGHAAIANNAPYMLVGIPGEHTVFYTSAKRTIASAGVNNWIKEGDENYANGVLTVTTKNRYPMKFVNEKSNPRFVADAIDSNQQTLRIDVEKEGRFYIRVTDTKMTESPIVWGGITPEQIATGVEHVITEHVVKHDNAVYNIMGMKMTNGVKPRGLYIKNGKKFVY